MTPLQAMQATLAGEHAAVHLHAVVGARVSASAQPDVWSLVRETYELHRERRDQLVAMVTAAGGTPVAAEVSYELPGPADTPAQLEALARTVEERCAAVYADMVGSTARAGRQWALDALEDAARRSVLLGGTAEPFPGVGEM